MSICFSVLICVYKNDCHILFRKALDSIYKLQSLKPTEVVLVIDGPISKLHESSICESGIPATILKLVRNEQNIGLSNSLNVGLSHCKFEYVARMDADDFSYPNRFKEQFEFIIANQECDVLSSYVRDIDDAGYELGVRKPPLFHHQIVKYALYRSPVNHGCCIYKKQSVINSGGYTDLPQCQDYALFLSMIEHGYVFANLPIIHMNVRFHDLYRKKRGIKYISEEFVLFNYIKRISNNTQATFSVTVRIMVRLMPALAVNYIYRMLRRKF